MRSSKRYCLQTAMLAAAVLFSGCASRVPLTRALIREYNLTYADIKRLQLYISDDILLEQEAKNINKDIDQTHSLKKVEDQYIKRVYFKRQTPCIAVEAEADRVKVAFEPSDNLTFMYESNPEREGYVYRPEKKAAKEEQSSQAEGSLFNNWRIVGQQTYADSTYNVIVRDEFPLLLVDQASLRTFLVESRTVPGMRQMDIDKGKGK
ncbi:MAG TPA: hypothetical protein VKF42_00080 [Chitinivibrionales bacterium]|nr:hypothetical protein [Chitinivibrionales bacterium]